MCEQAMTMQGVQRLVREAGWRDRGEPHPVPHPHGSPSMSSDTGIRRMSPVNSQVVFWASIPEVPSKTYGTRE